MLAFEEDLVFCSISIQLSQKRMCQLVMSWQFMRSLMAKKIFVSGNIKLSGKWFNKIEDCFYIPEEDDKIKSKCVI